ncbi:SAM-dependent methyltransferase [Streptomyces spiramenti]|uniref:SAM-dependent methyltransferase n=1 Tax=Streptomyces spiramenti TaxID=2720606 RepID=UPI003B83812D
MDAERDGRTRAPGGRVRAPGARHGTATGGRVTDGASAGGPAEERPTENGPTENGAAAGGGWAGWREAAERALYGGASASDGPGTDTGGFFLREAPAAHFRTAVHASPLFATAVAELLLRLDEALGRPPVLDLVDVGAGRGELLAGVLAALPPRVADRVRPCAVERAARPAGLPDRVAWSAAPPAGITGLLFANEWLDNVPLDVVESDGTGQLRHVLVRADGRERRGGPVGGEDAAWLRRWWPSCGSPGERAEIGLTRDAAWAGAVATVRRGLAVAVDYSHARTTRPPLGSLTGYRDGRQVAPVPDGGCDLTAHVAMDACAAAGAAVPGAGAPLLLTQRTALRRLGTDGRRPPLELARTDPAGYLRALARAGEAAELTDPAGFGGFEWLVQPVGVPSPLAAGPTGETDPA